MIRGLAEKQGKSKSKAKGKGKGLKDPVEVAKGLNWDEGMTRYENAKVTIPKLPIEWLKELSLWFERQFQGCGRAVDAEDCDLFQHVSKRQKERLFKTLLKHWRPTQNSSSGILGLGLISTVCSRIPPAPYHPHMSRGMFVLVTMSVAFGLVLALRCHARFTSLGKGSTKMEKGTLALMFSACVDHMIDHPESSVGLLFAIQALVDFELTQNKAVVVDALRHTIRL